MRFIVQNLNVEGFIQEGSYEERGYHVPVVYSVDATVEEIKQEHERAVARIKELAV